MNATDPPSRDPHPYLTSLELLAKGAAAAAALEPVDRLDEQISQAGARIALHREQSIIAMQQELQNSIVKMSHSIKSEIVGVKDRVDELADGLARVEQKLKEREASGPDGPTARKAAK